MNHTLSPLLHRVLSAVVLLAVVVLPMRAASAAAKHTGLKPNFLIVLCDDLGYGDLACYGHPVIKSPNIDKLAKEGDSADQLLRGGGQLLTVPGPA